MARLLSGLSLPKRQTCNTALGVDRVVLWSYSSMLVFAMADPILPRRLSDLLR
jgi:hypothetical protein